MSVNKINRSDSASPLLPNSAVPEARGPTKPKHPNIFSKSLFSKAPKNSSTSMAPRDTTPLRSAEQRAAPSDAPVQNARPGSMKPASSLLGRAQRAVSSGAKVVTSSMHQASKVMSNAYQAHNEPRYTRLPTDHSQEYQVRPHTPPAARTEVRADARMAENIRPPVNGRENGQGGRPQGVGPAPGRTTPLQPSSQPLAASRPAVHNAPSSGRNPSSAPAKTSERAPLGVHTGNVPQPAARGRPAPGGAENADPNVGRLSPHAAAKKSMPPLVASFSTDRPLEPKQLVEAMVNLAKGTIFEGAVSQAIADNPKWGQQMQQRWNTLRLSIAGAKDGGNTQAPSLEEMVARRPASFIKFMGGGHEGSFARLMKPIRHSAPAPQAQPSAAPEVHAHAQSARPQGRYDVRPQSSRTEHAVQRPVRNESKPVDERTQLTATLRNLDQQIAASELKGKQILSRMFDPATIGPAVAAATRESYAHKAQHNELIAARNQVQAQLQHVGTNAAAGQLIGQIKDVDGKIAELEQRAGELNTVMKRSPQGSEQWVAARREKNSLRPAWKELTSQRADMQAKLEGLRPEFQQARELAKGLAELAKVQGGEMRQSRDGSKIYLDRTSIENHYDRFDQSRHLLNKRDNLENAQQQLNKLINSGMLEGIAPSERRELKQLATLDIGDQFNKLNDLKGTVAEIKGALKSMGAGGLYEGIRTTPEQRAHDDAEARRNAQEALNNNY